MKLFIKLMLFIVVVALAAPFIIKGPNGRPLMSLDRLHTPNVKLPDFGKAAEVLKADLGASGNTPAKVASVFKWQDEKGVWHFSDNEEEGHGARKITMDPNANVVHFSATEHSQPQSASMGGSSGDNHSGTSAAAGFAPVGAITKLIDDSKNVAALQEEHVARQERALQ